MTRIIACALILALAVSGCSTPQTHHRDTFCSSGTTLLDAHFDGGQLGSCNISDDGDFELILFPEDEPPINKSPW
ncbi:MAG: hypothetical protein OET46_04430, partial [Xanthomonadales bacterium]|nr:hypothetical protein [Xanthomonadales bacterium]